MKSFLSFHITVLSFYHRGLQLQSRKSRATYNNSQAWPWITKWSCAKVNRVLPSEHTGDSKPLLPITHAMTLHMDITRWSIPQSDWLYFLQLKMEKLYIVSKNKTWSWLWLRSWLLTAKFSLKLKKVGKTIRQFRYESETRSVVSNCLQPHGLYSPWNSPGLLE